MTDVESAVVTRPQAPRALAAQVKFYNILKLNNEKIARGLESPFFSNGDVFFF